jgi:hypothetical protein
MPENKQTGQIVVTGCKETIFRVPMNEKGPGKR